MEGLQGTTGKELVPYKQGVSLGTVIRASLGRFLPGSILGLGSVFALLGLGPGEWLGAAAIFGAGVGALTLGFGLGLEALRRWLYPDAKVEGRRSFVAGLMAPVAAFVTAALAGSGGGYVAFAGLLFMVALITAVLMFFAWLTPTPEDMRGAEYRLGDGLLDRPTSSS